MKAVNKLLSIALICVGVGASHTKVYAGENVFNNLSVINVNVDDTDKEFFDALYKMRINSVKQDEEIFDTLGVSKMNVLGNNKYYKDTHNEDENCLGESDILNGKYALDEKYYELYEKSGLCKKYNLDDDPVLYAESDLNDEDTDNQVIENQYNLNDDITLSKERSFNKNEKTFKLEDVIDKAVENSYVVKTKESDLEKLKNLYDDEIGVSNNLEERLEENDEFKHLQRKSERTEEEENRYRYLIMRYGKPMDNEEIKKSRKTVITTPIKNEYSLYEGNNDVLLSKNAVKEDIYESYVELTKLTEEIRMQKKRLKVSKGKFNKIETENELGTISKICKDESQVDFLNQNQILGNLRRDFSVKVKEFNKLIGVPINDTYKRFVNDYYLGYLALKPYERYVKDAFKNRAEVLNGDKLIELKDYEKDVSLGIYGEYDREFTIAKYSLENAKDDLALIKLNIKMEIKKLYDDLKIKCKTLESYRAEYEDAKSKNKELKIKYDLGTISRIDFDSDSLAYDEKISKYRNLQRDIWLANLKLDNACLLGTSYKLK